MTLRLPKLLDDGCVLQAGVDMHIWGTGDPYGAGERRRNLERAVWSDRSWRAVRADHMLRGRSGAYLTAVLCGRGVPVLRAVEYGTAYGLGARRLSTGVGP